MRFSQKPIAILGSGPAGLMAAHAVGMAGQPFALFSKTLESKIGGAQFLHQHIPALCDEKPDAIVTYKVTKFSTAEEYEFKVYGERLEDRLSRPQSVSIAHVHDGMTQPAWSLMRVYERLWEVMAGKVNEADVTPEWIDEHGSDFEFIISTIPAHALCRRTAGLEDGPMHRFTNSSIQIKQPCELMDNIPDNTIVYDGTPLRPWYRGSKLFGITSCEWPIKVNTPFKNMINVVKPLATNCDCYPDIVREGRYGRWQKGILTHDAFIGTLKALDARGMLH